MLPIPPRKGNQGSLHWNSFHHQHPKTLSSNTGWLVDRQKKSIVETNSKFPLEIDGSKTHPLSGAYLHSLNLPKWVKLGSTPLFGSTIVSFLANSVRFTESKSPIPQLNTKLPGSRRYDLEGSTIRWWGPPGRGNTALFVKRPCAPKPETWEYSSSKMFT